MFETRDTLIKEDTNRNNVAYVCRREFADKMKSAVHNAFFGFNQLFVDEEKWLQTAVTRIHEICKNEDQARRTQIMLKN